MDEVLPADRPQLSLREGFDESHWLLIGPFLAMISVVVYAFAKWLFWTPAKRLRAKHYMLKIWSRFRKKLAMCHLDYFFTTLIPYVLISLVAMAGPWLVVLLGLGLISGIILLIIFFPLFLFCSQPVASCSMCGGARLGGGF